MNQDAVSSTSAFDQLLRRIPNMEFDPAQSPTKRRSSFIRGLSSLPVVWDTAEG